MGKLAYKTLPDHQNKSWPSGINYIIGNEGCERFSYYGMNAILYIYCVTLFVSNSLSQDEASNMATSTVHLFKTGVYAFPMIGAIIADRFLGKYNTILYLSLVYCLGHVVLSFTEGSIYGMAMGLGLIAIGSGGIKPCVSAHVGDQFGRGNWNLLEKVYQIFYFIINFGSFFAVLLIPLIKEWFGWRVAFLVPGVLMFIATFVFWLGRKSFVHIAPSPGKRLGFFDSLSSVLLFLTFGSLFFTAQKSFLTIILVSLSCFISGLLLFFYRQKLQKDDGFLSVSLFMAKDYFQSLFYKRNLVLAYAGSNSGPLVSAPSVSANAQREFGNEAVEGVKAVGRIISIFIMVSIFWALFDQHSSSWIRQAEMMDLSLYLPIFGEITMLSSQIPSLNPIMVMALIPFWAYVVEPFLSRLGISMTPLKKMTLGMLLASFSFVAVALLQGQIDADPSMKIHVLWQIIPYLLITTSEVLVSITGLEFAYSQAPKRMKSTVMGFWLLTVALGNVLVAVLARFSHLALENFFWLFALLMALAGLVFAVRAKNYQVKDYTQ